MTTSFTRTQKIRFRHCDPAGIVYYPRYLEMVTEIVEDWFADGLGLSFNELHIQRGLAVPTVHLDCDFLAPSALGDMVELALSVASLGTSSVKLDVLMTCGSETRMRVRVVLVLTQGQSAGAIPIPEDLRAAMARFQQQEGTN